MTPQTDPDDKEAPEPEAPAAPPAKSKPAKKPLPPWASGLMLVGFLVMALGVGYVIWLLVNTFNLAQQDGFSSGRVVEKGVYEDPLGWGSELLVDKKPGKPARIRFLLRDVARKPIIDATVEVLMVRPDAPSAASPRAALTMSEPGVYRGEVDMPGSGEWEARIQVKEGGNAYQITRRVVLPESEEEKADKAKAEESPAK